MEQLGINPSLLLAQIISFGVLVWVLNRFLYRKIKNSLEERQKAVAETFSRQKEVEEKLNEIENEQAEARKKAHKERDQLVAEAKEAGQESRRVLLAEAEAQAKKILDEAKARIDQETVASKEELKLVAKQLAISIARSVLQKELEEPRVQEKQLQTSLKKLRELGIMGHIRSQRA